MLQYGVYSVISPEGCASILWKSAEKAEAAADAMRITADNLKDFGLIDEVLPEPLGAAHRDPRQMAESIQNALATHLDQLESQPIEQLLDNRLERISAYGQFKDA